MNYACPCCGYKTLTEAPPGTYDICEICFWEDDGVQYHDPDYSGGANKVSLREAQSNYNKFGACEERCVKFVRKPTNSDEYEGPRDISKIQRMPINEIINIFISTGTPVEVVLDIYKGIIHIKDSNFIFNAGQLEDYISLEESIEYTMLVNRDNPNINFGDEKLYKISKQEVENRIQAIKSKFIVAVKLKHLS